MGNPILYIVIPCYNEEAVLPLTSGMFLKKIKDLAAAGRISDKSRILFVNDGSKDKTWDIIRSLAEADEHYRGVCLSRNRGHQNALLAGLMTAKDLADVTISIDCDGQDDINAMDAMIDEYLAGMDVVYGVRSKRETDTWFKRTTAEGFYKVMKALGADVVFNHADYRLLSKRALEGLAEFREVNLFLRGLVPLVGYRCSSVYYERAERIAGESHYPLKKMLRRHHQPFGKAAAPHHAGGHAGQRRQLYRHHRHAHHKAGGLYGNGLDKHDLRHLLPGRRAAAGNRRHRGICGQDLQRNKSASTLHHQRDDV